MRSANNFKRIVAFCGTRGVPARYGGFETAVDEISRRLVGDGHMVDVFCRLSSADTVEETHLGRTLVYVRGSRIRSLDTFVSAIQTGWHLWRHRSRYRHVFWFNNANFPGILMTWLAGIPMSVNTDGLEWRRAKWSWPFKVYYVVCSFLVSRLCCSLITDSLAMQRFYLRLFATDSHFIPYGAPVGLFVPAARQKEILKRFGLVKNRYFLQITRIEPDNLSLKVALGFCESGLGRHGFKMLIVGHRHRSRYSQRLLAYDGRHGLSVQPATYDPEVLYVLRRNCFCYVHGNSVGGTNPALLEAMAACPRVMAIDCEFSREILGTAGVFFKRSAIGSTFRQLLATDENEAGLQARVFHLYCWDDVAESYLHLVDGRPADYQMWSEPRLRWQDRQLPELDPSSRRGKQLSNDRSDFFPRTYTSRQPMSPNSLYFGSSRRRNHICHLDRSEAARDLRQSETPWCAWGCSEATRRRS